MGITSAIMIISGIGIIAAVILVLAAKFMHVEEDERIGKVVECLPGANCGACGYAGCDGYAEALANGAEPILCTPGGTATATTLSEVLGVEIEAIKKYGSAWGCDICQEICPYTLHAKRQGTIYTEVEFFKKDLIPQLTSEILNAMTDEDFSCRAYSWRGRGVIERNLDIMKNEGK